MPAVEGRGSAGDGRKAPFSAGKGEKRQFFNGFFAFFLRRAAEGAAGSLRPGGASGSRRAGGGRPERGARKRAEALPEGAFEGGAGEKGAGRCHVRPEKGACRGRYGGQSAGGYSRKGHAAEKDVAAAGRALRMRPPLPPGNAFAGREVRAAKRPFPRRAAFFCPGRMRA